MATALQKRVKKWAGKSLDKAMGPKKLVAARPPIMAKRPSVTVVGLGGSDKDFVEGYQAIFGRPK